MPFDSAFARIVDLHFLVAEKNLPDVGVVIPHNAFDKRALSGAVSAEQRMHRAGAHDHRNIVQRLEGAKMLAHVQGGQARGLDGGSDNGSDFVSHNHVIPATKLLESDTAPNTPFCIVTIFTAALWLPGSVAAQQSSSSTHS